MTQQMEFEGGEKFSSFEVNFYFKHQLKVKIRVKS